MRMFFRHNHNMVMNRANAKRVPATPELKNPLSLPTGAAW